jgi:AraC-like DNA-binding protein
MSATPELTQRLHADDPCLNGGEDALRIPRWDFVERPVPEDWRDGQAREAALALAHDPRPERTRAANSPGSHPLTRRAVRRTVRYIHSNLDSKLTWKELAAAIGMDVFEFGRSFKMSTGMTPRQYVIRRRLRRAVKLLRSGEMGIIDVALEVGCSCQSHLTTLFVRYFKTTPGAFRRALNERRRDQQSELAQSSMLRDLRDHRQTQRNGPIKPRSEQAWLQREDQAYAADRFRASMGRQRNAFSALLTERQ